MIRRRSLRATVAVVFASSLVLAGCGGSVGLGGSDDSSSSAGQEKEEPKLEWGPWQQFDEGGATVFASSDDIAVFYGGTFQEMRAYNSEGKKLWSKPVLVPPADAGVPGPESYIKGDTLVYQDPETGKIHGLNTADGEELWTFDPSSLGKCSAKAYWLLDDKPVTDSDTIVLALDGLSQDAQEIAGCSGESPAVVGLQLPEGTSGAQEIKPQWQSPALPKGSQVSMPTVDPTSEYLTHVGSTPDKRVLQRTSLKDGKAQAAVVTRIDGDVNPDAIGNIYQLSAVDADNYGIERLDEEYSATYDIYTVKEWSDVDAANDPAVAINADADGADCIAGGMHELGGKKYCYKATEEGAVFAEVGDNLTGGKLEGVQRKPVSDEFSQGAIGTGLPHESPAGITKDGKLYGLVPSPANTLDAVSMTDGEVLWSAPAEADASSAARDAGYVAGADAVVFGQGDAAVAVDASTGEELWREGVGAGEGSAGELRLGWLSMTDSAVALKIDGGDKPNGQTKFRVLRSEEG